MTVFLFVFSLVLFSVFFLESHESCKAQRYDFSVSIQYLTLNT